MGVHEPEQGVPGLKNGWWKPEPHLRVHHCSGATLSALITVALYCYTTDRQESLYKYKAVESIPKMVTLMEKRTISSTLKCTWLRSALVQK